MVSAVIGAGDADISLLTDVLLSAGAQRIISSDAHVYTATADPLLVRGERRRQATPRTRLEIVSGAAEADAVRTALRENTTGPVDILVQMADT